MTVADRESRAGEGKAIPLSRSAALAIEGPG